MKRSAAYIVLLLVVVIFAAILSVRVFTREQAQPPEETPQQAPQIITMPPETNPGQAVVTMPPTMPPTPTPEPTEEPVFETRAPIETESPTATEPPQPVDQSGSFRSNTGTGLNLVVDWSAYGTGGDTVKLTVSFSAESYSFYTASLYQSLVLNVNGATYSANSPNISYDGADLQKTPMTTFTVEVPHGQTTLDAVWYYKGSYSGVEMTEITAGTTISLG